MSGAAASDVAIACDAQADRRRNRCALGHIPPAEHEATYYREHQQSKEVA